MQAAVLPGQLPWYWLDRCATAILLPCVRDVAAATTDLVHCQPGTQQCNSWYGQGPKECPLSGDAAAFNSWAGCKALDTCDRCLMYGGEQPQCVWCVASGKCVGAQTADAISSQCSKKLTRGPKVCPKSATNTTKP